MKLEVKNGYSEIDFANAICQNMPHEPIQSTATLSSEAIPKKKATNLPMQFLEGAKKLYQAAETKIATDKKEKAKMPSPLPVQQREREAPRKETESEIRRRQGVKRPNSPAGGIKE